MKTRLGHWLVTPWAQRLVKRNFWKRCVQTENKPQSRSLPLCTLSVSGAPNTVAILGKGLPGAWTLKLPDLFEG